MSLRTHTPNIANRAHTPGSSPLHAVYAHARRLALGAVSLTMMLFALIPAFAVGAASPYPANTVVSSYFDPRYCGNGAVSVVSDAGGNLIDVCTSTGERITPVYPDYAPTIGYTSPVYTDVSSYAYTTPTYTAAIPNTVSNAYGYSTGAYAESGLVYGSRQYTDTRTNCPNGDVTQTGATYVCTATGAPAVVVG